MILTDEEFNTLKRKLFNDYSLESISLLKRLSIEDIREYVRASTPSANSDFNPIKWVEFPIIDELLEILKDKTKICLACEIETILRSLFELPFLKETLNPSK